MISYNILADYLARDHRSRLYFHIPQYILDWEWRKKRLFVEFGLWSADIMCLQEVDRFNDLEEELAIRGYAGIWKMRTGNAVDGCAIFWRTNRFQLRHKEHIEFNKLGLRDNVAQICVLESRKQNPAEKPSTPSDDSYGQSRGVNRIVICNIHVLYNPRRGEMKLGQVRQLLDRAYAVSRTWNDAPVIVCGDFNCTPKSHLYKFISNQKLSLSGLARDQISGQSAASRYPSRPYVEAGYRPQHYRANHTEPKDAEQENNFKISESHQKPQNDAQNQSQNEKQTSPNMLKDVAESDPETPAMHEISTDHVNLKDNMNHDHDPPLEAGQSDVNTKKPMCDDGLLDSRSLNDFHVSLSSLSLGTSPSNDEGYRLEKLNPVSVSTTEEEVGAESSFQDTCITPSTNNGYLNEVDELRVEDLPSDGDLGNTDTTKMLPYTKDNIPDIADHSIYIDSHSEELNQLPEKSVLASESNRELLEEHGSGQADSLINDKCNLEKNSDPNFFEELIGTEDARDHMECYTDNNFQFSPIHTPGIAGTTGNTSDLTSLHNGETNSSADRIHDPVAFPPTNTGYSYNPYLWTPMEVEAATGNAECSLVEHGLKLRSAYTDVEDCAGTKDPNKEPEVTSYHRLFMGTVDYIWYSEGLQTVKVLDTIPKHILQRTPGFPTRKWGSDHLALACELAFTTGAETSK